MEAKAGYIVNEELLRRIEYPLEDRVLRNQPQERYTLPAGRFYRARLVP